MNTKCTKKNGNFVSFFVSFIHKNKQKSVFVIKHETIVFQDMLVFPPQQEAQNGETIIISDILQGEYMIVFFSKNIF